MGNTDMETYSKIARTAELILFDCVFEPGGVRHGGIAAGLGRSGQFSRPEQQLKILRCTGRTHSNNATVLPESRVLASHDPK